MEPKLHSWDALEPVPLKPAGQVSEVFLGIGSLDYRSAAHFVSQLSYGRNSDVCDPFIVLQESRGTCSTKHALLRRLAMEQDIDAVLVIGIYDMHERNTPGVRSVLRKYGIAGLPEAHCYLRVGENRVDVTRGLNARPAEAISHFLHEEEIGPEQIGDYKQVLHRRFLEKWIAESGQAGGRDLEEIWRIREECIAALSGERVHHTDS